MGSVVGDAAAETVWEWGDESGASADVAEYPGFYFQYLQSAVEREPIFVCFCDDVGVMTLVSMLGSARNL